MNDYPQRLAAHLDARTVAENHKAGLLLIEMKQILGSMHGKNFLGGVQKRLKPYCKVGPTSPNHLSKCIKLAKEWPEDFVVALDRKKVPWFNVLKGVFACSQTRSIKSADRRKAIVQQIQTHLLNFPKSRDENQVKRWNDALDSIRDGFAVQLGSGGQQKQLFEAGDAIAERLRDATERMKKVRKFLDASQRKRLDRTIANLDKTAKTVKALIEARQKDLRRADA